MSSCLSKKVLVIAAHADDEALGCGGTLARHSEQGDEVSVIFLTNGVGSRGDGAMTAEARQRKEAMENALAILGVARHHLADFPDNALDSAPLLEITKAIESVIAEWGIPDVLYTHHPGDLNIDHRIAHQAALTCFRPQPALAGKPSEIFLFEVLSSTAWSGIHTGSHFLPTCHCDITHTLGKKLEALEAYHAEMRSWPHARSLPSAEALARYRGATVGLEAAEAFCVERIIR